MNKSFIIFFYDSKSKERILFNKTTRTTTVNKTRENKRLHYTIMAMLMMMELSGFHIILYIILFNDWIASFPLIKHKILSISMIKREEYDEKLCIESLKIDTKKCSIDYL